MNRKVGVLGGGISGVGAALLAKANGDTVWVSDAGEINKVHKETLHRYSIPFEESGHDFERLVDCDIIVKSPGIPAKSQIIHDLLAAGKEVIGEIEWAFRHTKGRIIGITGTNGKTTTTLLCHHFLKQSGLNVAMVGNVGESFCQFLATSDADWYVCELSSFQLEDVDTFRPDVAILLNITPDHLDRYAYSMDAYANAKLNIARRMTERDTLIYNAMDPITVGKVMSTETEARLNSIRATDLSGDDKVYVTDDLLLDLSRARLMGRHNQVNVLAAARAALAAGCEASMLQPALESFTNASHRMERVGTYEGVTYINDSKATNTEAVYYALEAMKAPVIWIAGGQDKGNDYTTILNLVEKKVKALICLGIDNRKLNETFSTRVKHISETTTMREAVRRAASLASSGDIVLLSPACASFDLFENYEDRGNQFKKEVSELKDV